MQQQQQLQKIRQMQSHTKKKQLWVAVVAEGNSSKRTGCTCTKYMLEEGQDTAAWCLFCIRQ